MEPLASNLTRTPNYNLLVSLKPADLERFADTKTPVKSVGLVDPVKPMDVAELVAIGGPVDGGGPMDGGGPVGTIALPLA